MQSTEDRLSALEKQLAIQTRALTEQQLSIHDIEKNETMLLGLVTRLNEDIRAVQARLDTMQAQMSTMDGKLDQILALLKPQP